MAPLAFGVSLILSLLLVPVVRHLSLQLGRVASPRKDRWHKKPTPISGGVGMFFAFAGSLLFTHGETEIRWGLLAGSAIMFGLGFYDDLKPLTPPAKMTGQILAAAVVVFSGYTTGFFSSALPNILITIVWLVMITNAINLLDNMDGLAGGISLIAAGFISFFFWRSHSPELLLLSLAMAGAILGFLVFNFPPASIFMGDSGSLFLGFTLAALAIARTPQASNVFAVMSVPTLIFLLPILDTTLVTFTRILRGQSPVQGGRDHTSHRLVAFGLSERQAVLVLYAIALAAGVVGAAIESLDYSLSLVLIPVIVLFFALLAAYLGRLKA
ncbi:MAG: MraY family glycosyltransferase, partial [Anaerolineales bacterium]